MRVARFYYKDDWNSKCDINHISTYTLMKMVILSGEDRNSLCVDNFWEHGEYCAQHPYERLEVEDNGKYVSVCASDCGRYDCCHLPISDALPLIIEWSEKYSSQTAKK